MRSPEKGLRDIIGLLEAQGVGAAAPQVVHGPQRHAVGVDGQGDGLERQNTVGIHEEPSVLIGGLVGGDDMMFSWLVSKLVLLVLLLV